MPVSSTGRGAVLLVLIVDLDRRLSRATGQKNGFRRAPQAQIKCFLPAIARFRASSPRSTAPPIACRPGLYRSVSPTRSSMRKAVLIYTIHVWQIKRFEVENSQISENQYP
jgi:hypothetical protein